MGKILYIGLFLISLLLITTLVSAADETNLNPGSSPEKPNQVYPPYPGEFDRADIRIPQERMEAETGASARVGQSNSDQENHTEKYRENRPAMFGEGIPESNIASISVGITLVILCIIMYAGVIFGRPYHYDASRRARIWLCIGHIICALLLVSVIWRGISLQSTDPVHLFLLVGVYAMVGIQISLILSSCIQAVSLAYARPILHLPQAHMIFAFIAIILILTNRIPYLPPFPGTILEISAFYLPGATLALITGHIIRRDENIQAQMISDHTITISGAHSNSEYPPSFPEKLSTKYHRVQVIGSGGMAVVYRARRNSDGMEVALKIPFSPDETSGKTFLNEITIWRDLHHPHIVNLFDLNIFPTPYVEIEYLPRSLKDITTPLSPQRAVEIIQEIGSALAYAHDKGVIHRDIKPGNVLISDEGIVKLTDWGLCRSVHRGDDTRNTSFSLYYATPEQLAPEQYGGGDERTDIYQTAVLLYELLCGRPPFNPLSIGDMYIQVRESRFTLPSQVSPSLSHFDAIITKALQSFPQDRFSSMTEFLQALEKIAT
ncbi:MAG TPA: serine/threonine-protein kinase [Methanospirillum sp.]|nr:serine/threonine-protein kinase [Methanospirillum sp.]